MNISERKFNRLIKRNGQKAPGEVMKWYFAIVVICRTTTTQFFMNSRLQHIRTNITVPVDSWDNENFCCCQLLRVFGSSFQCENPRYPPANFGTMDLSLTVQASTFKLEGMGSLRGPIKVCTNYESRLTETLLRISQKQKGCHILSQKRLQCLQTHPSS